MSADLLVHLRSVGVVLSLDDEGRLAFDAPADVLTDELLAKMRSHRDGLIGCLRAEVVGEIIVPPATRVVHCKREPFDIRIDRSTKWGNPFKVGPDGTRDEVIQFYRWWVVNRPELMAALPELRGKALPRCLSRFLH